MKNLIYSSKRWGLSYWKRYLMLSLKNNKGRLKLVKGQTMLDRWNSYNDKLGVPPIHNEFNQLGKQKKIQSGCYECKSMKLIRDYEKGEIICGNCGLVILEVMTVPKSPTMDSKSDQWDGLMDNIEQILEKRISIQGWEF